MTPVRARRNGEFVEFHHLDFGEYGGGAYLSIFMIDGREVKALYRPPPPGEFVAERYVLADLPALKAEGFDIRTVEIFEGGEWVPAQLPKVLEP